MTTIAIVVVGSIVLLFVKVLKNIMLYYVIE
jgi:hypothetical protein